MELDYITRKYYKRLHILPRPSTLVLLYIALIIGLGIVNSGNFLSINHIMSSLMKYSILGLLLPALYAILLVSKVFNVKRVVGLSMAVLIASLPAEIIFYWLIGLRGLGILSTTGFIFIILSVFVNPALAVPLATVPTLIIFILINGISTGIVRGDLFITALTVQSLSLTAGLMYLLFLEDLGRKYGYSPVRIIRAFINTWFTGNPLKLESEFSRYSSSVGDLRVKIVTINREYSESLALIFPTLHFGPFRNIGSSRFIYHLQDLLEPRIKPFIFHTPGSHEHNLVSSEDSERIAKAINNAIDEVYRIESSFNMCKPYRVRASNGWESFVLNGPTFIALFLVNKKLGNDDLPYELWSVLNSVGENVDNNILLTAIADSHSFKGPKVEDVSEVMDVITRALNKYSCNSGEEFYSGYGEATASVSECRGLCNDLVRVLTLRFKDGSRYALIYIYGNNMDGAFRLKLERVVKDMGVDDVEIVTPDDHSCAASIKETPYDIVSECASLLRAVKLAISEAIANEVKSSYSTMELIIKGVKFVGGNIFKIAYSLHDVGRLAERMLLLILILLNLLPTMFIFIK